VDDVDAASHQIGCQVRQPRGVAARVAVFDCDTTAFNKLLLCCFANLRLAPVVRFPDARVPHVLDERAVALGSSRRASAMASLA
jgi:hypothetical protein